MRTAAIVIVGARLAGLKVAEEIRRTESDVSIVMVGREERLPYDRPPLSKAVVTGGKEDSSLKPDSYYSDNGIDVQLGVSAVSVSPSRHEVALSDGSRLEYRELVLATGVAPRTLPVFAGYRGVHTLRTIEDALEIRRAARESAHALIVGAGFVGCELAASLRSRDVHVTLIESQPTPLASVLGEAVGSLVGRLHTAEGVDVRSASTIAHVYGSERVESVSLRDGSIVAPDFVVVGIGAEPELEWLSSSGIDVANGILCDEQGRTNTPHVWAIGDVSAWYADGAHRRVEHWSNVGEQAKTLVSAMLGTGTGARARTPAYFWSDQYDVKIQALGVVGPGMDITVVEDDGRRFAALYSVDGKLTGVVGAGRPKTVMPMRQRIMEGASLEDLEIG